MSSVSTIVAASRATSVPGDAHRDPDVGPAERRRVVDAVAGHRDDVTLGPERVRDPQLRLGRGAGEDQLPALAQEQVELGLAHRLELLARDDDDAVASDPHAARDLGGGQPVVAR